MISSEEVGGRNKCEATLLLAHLKKIKKMKNSFFFQTSNMYGKLVRRRRSFVKEIW